MKTLSVSLFAAWLTCLPLSASDSALRVRFGMKDFEPTKWDGSLEVTGATLRSAEGWRFERTDTMTGPAAWKASTRELTVRKRRSNSNLRNLMKQRKVRTPMSDNGLLIRLTNAGPDTQLSFRTAEGDFEFALRDLTLGKALKLLGGKVEAEPVADAQPVSAKRDDEDFPALAIAPDGAWSVAWISFTPGLDRNERSKSWKETPEDFDFLATPVGGDQVWLRTRSPSGSWTDPVAVTDAGCDVFKCAVAVDGSGATWVVWSEREQDAFTIKTRSFTADGAASAPAEISVGPGNQHSPVAVTAADGRIWVAWQGAEPEGRFFRVYACHQTESGEWSEVIDVSGPAAGNAWSPDLAAAKGEGAKVAVTWDSYDLGDYDVLAREFAQDGGAGEVLTVANSPDYEARPSAAYDGQQRLWVAYEFGGASWGKDWGAYDREDGIGLYKERQVAVRVYDGGKWKEPAADVSQALRGPGLSNARKAPAKAAKPEAKSTSDTTRKASQEAGESSPKKGGPLRNNLARIAADGQGRIWLLSRARQGTYHTPVGGVWISYASWLDGDRWTGPVLIPHSDNLLYNRLSVAASESGIAIAHSTDHRQDRVAVWVRSRRKTASPDARRDPFDNDVYVSALETNGVANPPALKEVAPPPDKQASQATLAEREALARIRGYRASVGETEMRILRGEFHRHTEISGDGMNDGPLEDMWRYGIDVAGMDWIGNGDHDNGGGREYPWWLTQKTTDAFHLPGRFDPLFSYERSVSYPEGHRNVIFVKRGIRTLPRLPKSNRDVEKPAPDTQMLYRYLRHFDGICASHTSATSMGTDWRDNDPVVEPFVEIYQGARQNYERPGAPRCPTEADSIGGWEPKGFINLALKKGYRMSFQASSDHGSTHISYCLVYAEDATRQAIFDAMKARHTYGATDNIVADLRCSASGREYMMGDAFSMTEAPTLRLKLIGTSPFAKVTLIKDDEEVEVWTPGTETVDLTWTGEKPAKGITSYYYFRGEQENTELVWVSPVWITGE